MKVKDVMTSDVKSCGLGNQPRRGGQDHVGRRLRSCPRH